MSDMPGDNAEILVDMMARSAVVNIFRCLYKDFIPKCIKDSNDFSATIYQSLSDLVDDANAWLRTENMYRVTGCESIGATLPNASYNIGTTVNPDYCKLLVQGDEDKKKYPTCKIVNCLRIYYRFKDENESEIPSQIGYYNLVPKLKLSLLWSNKTPENITEAIKRFNTTSKSELIPGKILNMETQVAYIDTIDTNYDGVAFEESEKSKFRPKNSFIRIFYENVECPKEQIGCKDFVPKRIKNDFLFGNHIYENFSQTMEKVSKWVSSQLNIRVINVQTLFVEYDKVGSTDINDNTQNIQSKYCTLFYVQVIRVYYTTLTTPLETPISLTYRVFIPCCVKKSLDMDEYERFETLYNREILPFIRYNLAVGIINIEMVPIYISSSEDGETMSSKNRKSLTLVKYVRIYFDGRIQEPPIGYYEIPTPLPPTPLPPTPSPSPPPLSTTPSQAPPPSTPLQTLPTTSPSPKPALPKSTVSKTCVIT
ncbi:DgyrCDS9052 [Dimorphilus gyrociliatus]|uniref:DgyrCDS9052 n=1 Tax=Dimorphilus gyrociliatus TaxID=2664684 RepID=A0A7I8W164_9ANNE|nr:DgyrCDS9052 [Dimorphilus gyrociliatus]